MWTVTSSRPKRIQQNNADWSRLARAPAPMVEGDSFYQQLTFLQTATCFTPALSPARKVHAFICQSLTFCSATQPLIWRSRFLRRCAQNMELYTSSHPPIPNILFLQTSSQDILLSLSLSCPTVAPYNAPRFSSETLALYKSLTYLLTDLPVFCC